MDRFHACTRCGKFARTHVCSRCKQTMQNTTLLNYHEGGWRLLKNQKHVSNLKISENKFWPRMAKSVKERKDILEHQLNHGFTSCFNGNDVCERCFMYNYRYKDRLWWVYQN